MARVCVMWTPGKMQLGSGEAEEGPNFRFDDYQDCGGQGRSSLVQRVVLTVVPSLAKMGSDALFLAREET